MTPVEANIPGGMVQFSRPIVQAGPWGVGRIRAGLILRSQLLGTRLNPATGTTGRLQQLQIRFSSATAVILPPTIYFQRRHQPTE